MRYDKEPWGGYNKWEEESKKYQQKMEDDTAQFGLFSFLFISFLAFCVLIETCVIVLGAFGGWGIPLIIVAIIVFGKAVGVTYRAFELDHDGSKRRSVEAGE